MRLLDDWKALIRDEAGVGCDTVHEAVIGGMGLRGSERRLAQMLYRAAMEYQKGEMGIEGPLAHELMGPAIVRAAKDIQTALLKAKR